MAKRKAKGKSKPKTKTKPKPKTKTRPKAKARPKTRPKPKSKAKPKAKPRAQNPPPITVPICSNFSVPAGAEIQWTGIPPAGCILTPDPGRPWPFDVAPPLSLPTPTPVTINAGLPIGQTYCFYASCCDRPICVTVT